MSNNKHSNLQHGRFLSVVVLTCNSETEEKEEKKQKAVEKWKGLDETQFVSALLRFVLFACIRVFVG